MTENKRRRRGPVAVAAGLMVGLIVSGFAVFNASQAAFSGTTDNLANYYKAGTVVITDNDSAGAMFTMTDYITPSQQVEKCMKVTYTGLSKAVGGVRLYTDGTSLSAPGDLTTSLLNIHIEKGTSGSASFRDCAGFVVDGTAAAYDYNGTLANFLTTCATNWAGAANSACNIKWTPDTNDAVWFRFTASLASTNDNLQGDYISGVPFIWEAQG